jgi:hypothetical protein
MKLASLFAALALAAALVAPVPAQHTRLLVATDHGIWVHATDHQLVRVTVASPHAADTAAPPSDRTFMELSAVKGDRSLEPRRLEPGAAYTYTIDPRADGVLVIPRTGQRHVAVSFRIASVPVDPSDPSTAPRPAVLIEIVSARTGDVLSFQSFPGFTGGVFVASGDVN